MNCIISHQRTNRFIKNTNTQKMMFHSFTKDAKPKNLTWLWIRWKPSEITVCTIIYCSLTLAKKEIIMIQSNMNLVPMLLMWYHTESSNIEDIHHSGRVKGDADFWPVLKIWGYMLVLVNICLTFWLNVDSVVL
jgi:hypothetical protein